MIEEEEFDTSDNKVVLTIIKHLIVQGAPALEHTQMHWEGGKDTLKLRR